MRELKINKVTQNVNEQEKYGADLDQALEVAGIGWYNLKYSLVLALCLISAIIEMIAYSLVLPAAVCDLQMSVRQRGLVASIPFVGIIITSYPWGYLIDTRGRKKTLIYSTLAAGIFSALSGVMPNLISFAVCKFLTSLCLACPSAVPYTYIGEILPPKNRDTILSMINATQVFGSALGPLLAWAIIPSDFRIDFSIYVFRPWRLLTIVYALFFIITGILMSFGPESPKFLVSQERYGEALKVLQNMYAGNKGKRPEEYPINMLFAPPNDREKGNFLTSLKVQTKPLLKWNYLKWLLLNAILLFGMLSVVNGLFTWVPDVLNKVMTGNGEGRTACRVIYDRLNQFAFGMVPFAAHLQLRHVFFGPPGPKMMTNLFNSLIARQSANVFFSYLWTSQEDAECNDKIDKITFIINSIAQVSCASIALVVSSTVRFIGKKNLLIMCFVIIGIFCISINFITKALLFAIVLSSMPLLVLAIGPISAYNVDIFPTHLRGMAMSISMMLGRTGSIMGTNVAGLLVNSACEEMFYFFGGLLLFCGLLSFLLPNSRANLQKKQNI